MKKKSLFAIRSFNLHKEQVLAIVNECIGSKERKTQRIYLEAFEHGYECGLTDAADCVRERFHADAKAEDFP